MIGRKPERQGSFSNIDDNNDDDGDNDNDDDNEDKDNDDHYLLMMEFSKGVGYYCHNEVEHFFGVLYGKLKFLALLFFHTILIFRYILPRGNRVSRRAFFLYLQYSCQFPCWSTRQIRLRLNFLIST